MQGKRRLYVGVLALSLFCQVVATGCGPSKDDDPKDDDPKPERKDNRNPIPLIIINGLKLAIKVIKGRRKGVVIVLLFGDKPLLPNTTLVGLPID